MLLRQQLTTIDPSGPRHSELTSEIARPTPRWRYLAHAAAGTVGEARTTTPRSRPDQSLVAGAAALHRAGVPRRRAGSCATATASPPRSSASAPTSAAAQHELQTLRSLRRLQPRSSRRSTPMSPPAPRRRRRSSPHSRARPRRLLVRRAPGLPQPTIGPPQLAAVLAWLDADAFTPACSPPSATCRAAAKAYRPPTSRPASTS